MKYVKLERTGLKVSRLCLGTMNFENIINEEESFEIMNKALELGINYFDTADVYGWNVKKGITEEIIGNWLSEDKSRRDKIVLATKVFGEMGDGVNEKGL